MNTCPCCSERLIRQIRAGQTYWFCHRCWQDMPALDSYSLGVGSSLQRSLSALVLSA
jgi:ribosomal protein L37AE/L43A